MTDTPTAMPNFEQRRDFTERKWVELRDQVEAEQLRDTSGTDGGLFDRACAYVTGSMARDEAYGGSDLDLFIIDEVPTESGYSTKLTRPEEAHLLSAIDAARRRAQFRAFSQRGRFVSTHSFRTMIEAIGDAEDDFSNRFTARMLLLLNSRPLVNPDGYHAAREAVVKQYWRQESDPQEPFFPIFLMNDIRRWWSMVLLNFENNNPPAPKGDPTDEQTESVRADRRVANLKLRYARLLAAWTPILGLLAVSEENGIRRADVNPILDRTPVERLRAIAEQQPAVRPEVADLLSRYEAYLEFMDCTKPELKAKVLLPDWRTAVKPQAYEFGNAVADVLRRVGEGRPLYRYVQI